MVRGEGMSLRPFVFGALAGVLLALSPACGTTAGVHCLPSNCNGCCDVNGVCQGGADALACGRDGHRCASCQPSEACTAGACGNSGNPTGGGSGTGGTSLDAGCQPSTCNGCCDGTGRCRGGNVSTACGLGGKACATCAGGEACVANACAPFQCPGCLDGTGQCQGGTLPSACGTNGASCVACAAGKTCLSGACQAATCGPANCSGCCDGNICVTTAQDTSRCGGNGSACRPCGPGLTCTNSACGTASGGGTGGSSTCPSTCTGCCDVAGSCQPGDKASACGEGGAPCESCTFCLNLGGPVCI